MPTSFGPSFSSEIEAAGLMGTPFSWAPDSGTISGREDLTPEQNTTLDAVVAAHDPNIPDPNDTPAVQAEVELRNSPGLLAIVRQMAADKSVTEDAMIDLIKALAT